VLGSRISAIVAAEAPRARLRLSAPTPYVVDRAAQVLLSTDLLVLPHGFVSELRHRDLYRDEWMCLVSEDNDEVGDKITVDQLAELPWVASYHGPTASTAAALQLRMLGVEPHVQVVTENFLTVPGLVAGSARVALVQRRLMELIPHGLGIRALPCPIEVTPLVEAMWWHPAYDDDPEHAYLRDVVVRASAEAAGSSIDGDRPDE
jgi:DNA-binding transcriptional LysR family regulator